MADCANITRRNAFKALAALPAAAGVLAGAKFGIDALLEDYAVAKAENAAASRAIDEAAKFPGRPEWPHVARRDFVPSMRWDVPDRRLLTVEEIGEAFDYIDKKIEFNSFLNSEATVARWKQEAKSERARVFELFAERQRAYAEWEERSGMRAAADRAKVTEARFCTVDDAIIDYRPQSIEEVRAKARFLEREWLTDEDEGYVIRVVKSLAPLPFEA